MNAGYDSFICIMYICEKMNKNVSLEGQKYGKENGKHLLLLKFNNIYAYSDPKLIIQQKTF